MKIAILGGDGFCGWATALRLSTCAHDVIIVDNFCRRRIDIELECSSLTPIRPLEERIRAWRETTGRTIRFLELDVARNYEPLAAFIRDEKPEVVVHFAEQRSAPYSMKSSRHRRYTVDNNINATTNVLTAIAESGHDVHVVHLGSVGVYGYTTAGLTLPEGYLPVTVEGSNGRFRREILYPADPGSVYHLTKAQDQLLFSFFNRNDGIRVTDLHQGIVWGVETPETALDHRLINRFDYDGDYGTVLNRFIVQAAIHHPLTVHGSGRQTRGFIHLRDSVRCIELAIAHPPRRGERVRIFNQVTETRTVLDIAKVVARVMGGRIEHVPNPRKECDQNELSVDNGGLRALGLTPTLLSDGLLDEVAHVARKHAFRCDTSKIPCRSSWQAASTTAVDAQTVS